MKNRIATYSALAAVAAAAGLALAVPAVAQSTGQGQAIVTVLPKHNGEMAPNISQQDLSLKVNGKAAQVTSWEALRGQQGPVELVILIDGSARNSLGEQLREIEQFVHTLPPNVKSSIAYMENGAAVFSGPLTSDRNQELKGLHLPGGLPGSDASPYFCLSDLAKRWPSPDRTARREVVMITDGVDNYERRLDPDDPYVQAAMTDSVRAGMVVYAIYWRDQGRLNATGFADNTGQSLLNEVAETTGGKNFWNGLGNPVSFTPFFDELKRRLDNQYELSFTAVSNGKPEVESMKFKLSAPNVEVDAPEQVVVVPSGTAQR